MNYTPLFQPISVGPLRLKNRFVMAPMSVHMTEDGSVSDAEIAAALSGAPLADAADRLLEQALARGGTDNITLVLLEDEGGASHD